MLEEIVGMAAELAPAVELAADIAGSVIMDKAKKKDQPPCDTEERLYSQSEAFVTSRHLL